MCIREDEIAARAMGVHVPQLKLMSFALSAAFAGLAGALFFHHQLRINPSNFSLLKSMEILLMVVLGGMGSLHGSVAGAITRVALLLRHVVEWLPETNNDRWW
jgi:branched-chain amino acid transport system permease protein